MPRTTAPVLLDAPVRFHGPSAGLILQDGDGVWFAAERNTSASYGEPDFGVWESREAAAVDRFRDVADSYGWTEDEPAAEDEAPAA